MEAYLGNIFIKLPLPRISQKKIDASGNSELSLILFSVTSIFHYRKSVSRPRKVAHRTYASPPIYFRIVKIIVNALECDTTL